MVVSTARSPLIITKIKLIEAGTILIAGVDEVGRGPLAGPVLAAAVIFPPGVFIPGVTDSKQLTPKQRESLFPLIKQKSMAVGLGLLGPREIDRLNILQASLTAMEKAVFQSQSETRFDPCRWKSSLEPAFCSEMSDPG